MQTRELYKKIATFGRELLEKRSFEEGLPFIAEYAKELIGADRASIFIYHKQSNELWTTLADGVERIIVPVDKGIAGKTIRTKEPQIVNDVNKEPEFYSEIDKETGYRTYNLITAPIYNSHHEVVGVLELINKEGGFCKEDIKLMRLFAQAVGSFVELMMLELEEEE
ncbi:RESPONSE REGULATOR PROTEIN-CheY-like nd an HD-GYP domain [hydrothermal vent metagenome]|uniref:RESPONSE REGULATOR PROTEIN-CheY-like nd an HD-GYP domain n=1 Tax=hydrothermal vent metagenome TaxID=652676 RepID=A0A1W1BML7_9ZZZZ